MVPQEKVEAHANRISELALNFEGQVASEIDAVIADVSAYAMKTLSTYQGVVRQSPENARRVLTVEDVFQRSLDASDYHPTVLAFIGNFVDQVDEFEELYGEMRNGLPLPYKVLLPSMALAEEDKEVLSNQGAAAVAALEGHPAQVTYELRQLLARSLGESEIGELTKGVSDVIRKMTKVGPIAKDQLILFFRTIGSLTYRRIESTGRVLKYSYVGPHDRKNRSFCTSLMDDRRYTQDEIAKMDNKQVTSVFDNCGGYGCRHWWSISEVLP